MVREVKSELSGPNLLDVLADVQRQLSEVKADNAAMRQEMAVARERSGLSLDPAHVNHFADKWFHHDRPVNEDASPVAAFDPFTGERIVSQRQAEMRALYS